MTRLTRSTTCSLVRFLALAEQARRHGRLAPLIWLAAVAAALSVAGLAGLRRRDHC